MKSILAISVLLISTFAMAQKSPTAAVYSMPAIEVGFKSNTATLPYSTANNQVTAFQLGVSGVYNLFESFGIRSGLFYSERPFSADYSGSTTKGKLTYFDVPVQLMFKFEEYAGVYAGPSLSIKMSDEVSPGSLTGIKSTVMPFTFGAQFKFLPNMGLNVFFETVSGELATNVESSRAVGVNLLFTMD